MGKVHIDLLTTVPNRYQSFRGNANSLEEYENLTIKRIDVSPHQNGFFDQSITFFNYAWAVLLFVKNNNYDLVFASSSRLMTAFLGALIARKKGIKLFLDIRDLFFDTMQDVLVGTKKIIVWDDQH